MWTAPCSSDLMQSNTNTAIAQHLNDLCVVSFKAWCYGLIVQFSSLEIICKSFYSQKAKLFFLKSKYKQQNRGTRTFFFLLFPYAGYLIKGICALVSILTELKHRHPEVKINFLWWLQA